MDVVWEIFCEELTRTSQEKQLQIHSFVLMSNHFHLIASTPLANISSCMHQFMGRVSRRLTRAGNRINETFAGRHFKCILHKNNYYLSAYKYNYRNPVTAGICSRVEDYPYSTLGVLARRGRPKIPLVADTYFWEDPVGTLRWLNTPPDPVKLEAVRAGLRRPWFMAKKNRMDNTCLLGQSETI